MGQRERAIGANTREVLEDIPAALAARFLDKIIDAVQGNDAVPSFKEGVTTDRNARLTLEQLRPLGPELLLEIETQSQRVTEMGDTKGAVSLTTVVYETASNEECVAFDEQLDDMGNSIGRGPVGAMADLVSFRESVARALTANGPGPVRRSALRDAGLCAAECERAVALERWRMKDPDLHPGISGPERQRALRIAAENARILQLAVLWQALGHFLAGGGAMSGRLRIRDADAGGRHRIDVRQVRRLHESLRGKPILHLDATMRPDLVRSILPDLAIETIDVAAPHMYGRHIQGSFGKSMLCPSPDLPTEESRRRENRLRECVDHVRWHARRVFPRPVLVVTYQAIEEAFDNIPNVDVAHFNAVAGLDRFKDVALLIGIGRPLPPSQELHALAGAYFDHVPEGRYRKDRAGIRMRSGETRGIDVIHHEDDRAETLRAAICDDELIQVIGRGRGVNRTVDNPLEVHVLADAALPLIYDRLTSWDLERPDLFQRMLLAGIAVDSPTDAAALHPLLFGNAHQAKMAFARTAFKAQNPMNSTYREMCLKSARYRRAGRGRGWQRAWWIEGSLDGVRSSLENALGALGDWQQES